MVCSKNTGDPLACDRCDRACHTQCCDPPLEEVPEGEWFCSVCESRPGGVLGYEGEEIEGDAAAEIEGASGDGYVEDAEEEVEKRNNRKRKGGASGDGAAKRKK